MGRHSGDTRSPGGPSARDARNSQVLAAKLAGNPYAPAPRHSLPAPAPVAPIRRSVRQRITATLAIAAVGGIGIVYAMGPFSTAVQPAEADGRASIFGVDSQSVVAGGTLTVREGEGYLSKDKPAEAASTTAESGWAPPAVTPDPGSAQAYASEALALRGFGSTEFDCLVALWNKESGWRVNAYNAGSGAYGIPQALPGSKMASAGADWETNAQTQVNWGLGYVIGRYGSPCGAWGHSQDVGWY